MNDDYEAKSDADTLHRAAEIQGDPKRHKKAHMHLTDKAAAAKAAHKQSAKHLHKKVKKGLEAAFPKDTNQAEQESPRANAQDEDA